MVYREPGVEGALARIFLIRGNLLLELARNRAVRGSAVFIESSTIRILVMAVPVNSNMIGS